MKTKYYKKILIILIFGLISLSALYTLQKSHKENIKNLNEQYLTRHLLENTSRNTLKLIGISQNDIVNENLENYNINIISNPHNNYYKILHTTNKNTDKDYICIYKYSLFSYKQIGTPLVFDNLIDIFILPINTDEKYMLFTRDLIGFETAPLDLTAKLNAFVFYKNDFVEALDLIENKEEYIIEKHNNKSNYKKYRTKSDIMLINSKSPILKVLSTYSESISAVVDYNLEGTPPYELDFDVIKTDNSFLEYFYDAKYHHFILGYMTIDQTNEVVGIISKNTKIINNNFQDTYTIIKENGEIFEIY